MFAPTHSRDRQLPRWFLFSGGIGLAIAIILADLLSHDLMAHDLGSGALLEVLWPASAMNRIGGPRVAAQILDALLMYGGQFLLYGSFGLLIGFTVRQIRGRRTQFKA